MTGEAVVYCDVDRDMSQWFWVIPGEDPSMIPQIHGPFRSEEAARRDARMFCKRHVLVPEESARCAAGVLSSIASDWLKNQRFYEQKEPTEENKSRAASARNNHVELRRHIDAIEAALRGA